MGTGARSLLWSRDSPRAASASGVSSCRPSGRTISPSYDLAVIASLHGVPRRAPHVVDSELGASASSPPQAASARGGRRSRVGRPSGPCNKALDAGAARLRSGPPVLSWLPAHALATRSAEPLPVEPTRPGAAASIGVPQRQGV